MNDIKSKLCIGAMLHDIGKAIYRYNDGRNHSISGSDFLKEKCNVNDKEILDQIKYHHGKNLSNASLKENSLSYITYWADNVAAGADRKDKNYGEFKGFKKDIPLESIFNVLNGNNQNFTYEFTEVYDNGKPVYPDEKEKVYSEEKYGKMIGNLESGLKAMEYTENYISSLLGLLEANLSFVPSSSNKSELVDISLFDHMKITAAVASGIYEYLSENERFNFKEEVFNGAKELYNEKAFMLLSMDLSGIQKFIYQVDTSDALKMLRAKSFYLEILLEHIVDELLVRLELTRANLIYSGGGHAYIITANTEKSRAIIDEFFQELKKWFIEYFGTDLYCAYGYTSCCANDFMNKPEGSYQDMFKSVSRKVSDNKFRRYNADEIIYLNNRSSDFSERECRVCRNTDRLIKDNLCSLCNSFIRLSNGVLKKEFVAIYEEGEYENSVILPFSRRMIMLNEKEARENINNDALIRLYSKNKMYTGFKMATRLWVGDYYKGRTFDELAKSSEGIKRIAVLRADIDNLGQTFVHGFERDDEKHYVSLSRSATFSRKLSMFFKLNINYILKHGDFDLEMEYGNDKARNVMVVYSGGDDLFIVGAWNEIIEAAIDINNALRKFSQGTLSISAGIGMYHSKFPVTSMAENSGDLEELSKMRDGKNSISLFNENHSYTWKRFEENVINEKFDLIDRYLSFNLERGNSFLYKVVDLIRRREERINIARFAYLLGRIEPKRSAESKEKEIYKEFREKMYKWIKVGGEDSRELLTAIYIYVYLNREREE